MTARIPTNETTNVERSVASAAAPFYRTRLFQEILLVGLGYLVYSQVRGLAGDRVTEAFANARAIIDVERALGVYHELAVQEWVLQSTNLIGFFNYVYFYLFFPLIIPSAIWLYLKRPAIYQLARTAFLISGGIAVIFFLTLPTAPPRLLDVGFVDTLTLSFTPTYSSIPGVNEYAALPSMHVGWTVLLAVALYKALPGFRYRAVVYVIPGLMFAATIVTGNHWFLDGALGLVVALVALKAAVVVEEGYERHRLERQQRRYRSEAQRDLN